jgi:glycosyltransferase involved in cell wall biosynthesis
LTALEDEGLKIAIVSERFFPDVFGGGEISNYLLAKALATKHKVTVYTVGDGSTERRDGFTIKRTIAEPSKLWPQDLRRGEVLSFSVMRGLLGDLKKADIVHVYGIRTLIGAVMASRLRGIPVVGTINDTWATCYFGLHFKDGKICNNCTAARFKECLDEHGGQPAAMPYLKTTMKQRRYYLSKFDGLIPISKMMRDLLMKEGIDCDMEVIPMIIETDLFSFAELPEEFKLGFVGRIDFSKGLDDAVRVAAGTGAGLRVAGEGPFMKEVKALVKELGVKDKVKFVGKVPYEKMPGEYQAVSLVLAPFKRIEPLGRVLPEANACGRAVITTNICGGSERIKDGENGFVFEPGDVKGMIGRVKALAENRVALERMGRNGRDRVVRDHSAEAIRERTEAFYERIIEKHKSRS